MTTDTATQAPHATVHWARETPHLRGPTRDRLRLLCFVSNSAQATLPAFTGGVHPVATAPGRRFHAVGSGLVWAVPAAYPG